MNLNPSFKVRVLFKDEHLKSEDCRVTCSKLSQPVHLISHDIISLLLITHHSMHQFGTQYTRHQNNAES